MLETLQREFTYLWYYFTVQFQQIFRYWALGILIGSGISVFLKDRIHGAFRAMSESRYGILGLIPASLLGIASPLCMYGTIPLAASVSRSGMRHDWLAAFMMTSILLNPQLIIYSAALGPTALAVRIVSCFLCGIAAGLLVRVFCRDKPFFDFSGFDEPKNRDTDPNLLLRLLKNIGRNIRATGPMFLLGIALSALFQRYVPQKVMVDVFGGNEAWGVLMAATVGVPLYACGGGTIPLIQQWLAEGMTLGSAAAFMITGPATKITNLGALKIVFGVKRFLLYLLFVMLFAFLTGIPVNLFA
ncbi:MAG: permease [Oscillospiraceae bacterium]|nr:permease [Oscillospiraceae bacterium]